MFKILQVIGSLHIIGLGIEPKGDDRYGEHSKSERALV